MSEKILQLNFKINVTKIEVSDHLVYTYPHELHDRVQKYLQKVRRLGRNEREGA